ncbi:TonB-dependent receptor domain-containing protein [Pseudomonas helleri]|uniref:TonB-dependent receptor domain-containing protein n=1 Tax=Pseudomonas helleri TaxID=1608996 RepID=UPI003FD33861
MFRAPHHFSYLCTRPTLLAACMTFSLYAQADSIQLQLPAQSLASSLSDIAQQANIALLFDEALLRNIKAPALSGDYSPQDAIQRLLKDTDFNLILVDKTYVVQPKEQGTTTSNSLELGALSVVGSGNEVDSSNVGKSTMTQTEINRYQANNIPSLLSTLPGIYLGGSLKPGGQTINIWGLGEAEDVQLTVDGATKSGFERYMQGTIFVEPELIKRLEVEKGPHDVRTGNGGFAGAVRMITKDAPDLLEDGKNTGGMLKYGYSSNDHQQVYSGAVYGRTDDGRADALVYYTKRDGDDMKLAGRMPDPNNNYPVNPKRLPNTAQDLDAQLLKINLHFNDEHSLGMTYSHVNNALWVPGGIYEYEKYNYGHYQPGFMPKGKVDTNSFYVQDAITWGDFTLTPSLRYDHVRNRGQENDAPLYNQAELGHDYSNQTYTGWSPRLSAFWKVTPNTALFVDYSKTWRAPVIDEQYEVQGTGNRTTTSLDLDPERITGWRAGNITNFDHIFSDSDHALIRTTLFRNKIDNEIFKATGVGCAQQTTAGGMSKECAGMLPMSNYRNIGSVTIKGFEVESFYDSTYVFGSLSYAWMTGKHEGAYTNPWGPDVWARDIPAPKWIAVLGTKIPSLDARVGWKGEFVRKTDRLPSDKYGPGPLTALGDSYYNQYANDDYNVQGLFAEWKPQQPYLKGTEVNFTLDNMFNKSYRPMLSGANAYSQGRNAKISITRFF